MFKCKYPSRFASSRAIVLLPDPTGPSIAMTVGPSRFFGFRRSGEVFPATLAVRGPLADGDRTGARPRLPSPTVPRRGSWRFTGTRSRPLRSALIFDSAFFFLPVLARFFSATIPTLFPLFFFFLLPVTALGGTMGFPCPFQGIAPSRFSIRARIWPRSSAVHSPLPRYHR